MVVSFCTVFAWCVEFRVIAFMKEKETMKQKDIGKIGDI